MVKKKAKPKRKSSKIKVKRPIRGVKVKKVKARKVAAKRKRSVLTKAQELAMEKIGEVTHYFPHVKAAAVLILKDSLRIGDEIYIKGHTTDFKEKVASMQLDRVPIQEGKKGREIGLLVKSRVRIGDSVYKV